MNKTDIENVLNIIKEQGFKYFFSEAQIRDLFAIQFGIDGFSVYPEYPTVIANYGDTEKEKRIHFDLLISKENESYLFEFKYKTYPIDVSLPNNKSIKLGYHKDTTNGHM